MNDIYEIQQLLFQNHLFLLFVLFSNVQESLAMHREHFWSMLGSSADQIKNRLTGKTCETHTLLLKKKMLIKIFTDGVSERRN